MQELLLARRSFDADEPVPPQYRALVERYYQLLSTQSGEKQAAPQPMKPMDDAKANGDATP
jgi:hypothetical protein